MLEEGISSRLTGFSEVQALVGNKVFPVMLPQETTLPAIVYAGISQTPVTGIFGQSGLIKKRLQVDCFALTYADVKKLETAVNHALLNFQGNLPDGTSVQKISTLNAIDLYESDAGIYHVTLDFEVWYITT